jgi:uncharacterized membrane protein YozB (DUF420 family)
MTLRDLPTLNAFLNGTSAALLVTGWFLIRSGRKEGHRKAMTAAFAASVLFLASYLTYHAFAGSVRFQGTGTARVVYLAILLSHTLLAAAAGPLALAVFVLARRGRFETHRRLARWTLPLWLYVSVTGVAVYLMLYRSAWGR